MWPSGLILAMTLTLNFQGQILNLLCLNQKWSFCHETKSKHIDWTPGLKCDQWDWPWPWPWHLNFQGQMWSWPFGDQGVRIYQIVTGVTSDVGVPSTHLVIIDIIIINIIIMTNHHDDVNIDQGHHFHCHNRQASNLLIDQFTWLHLERLTLLHGLSYFIFFFYISIPLNRKLHKE